MWTDAEAHLKSLQKLKWVSDDEARMWRASILCGQQRYDEALHTAGNLPGVESLLAVAHARLGHIAIAEGLAERALASRALGAVLARGHVYAAVGDDEAALIWYEREMQSLIY